MNTRSWWKRSIPWSLFLMVAITSLVFVGCPTEEEDTVSIEDRINEFEDDLNNDYDGLYKNWHPDSNTYETAKDSSTLNEQFPPDESGSYRIDDVDVDDSSVTATLSSSITYTNRDISFTMKKDDGDWFIEVLSGLSVELNSAD